MDKIMKSNLIAFAAVVAVPTAFATYLNVRMHLDTRRIAKKNAELYSNLNNTVNELRKTTNF